MTRKVAQTRDDFEVNKPRGIVRNYPVTGPLTQEEAIQRIMAVCGFPRYRALAATAIAVAMRSNSEPAPGGLITIRVIPGGFEIEERTGKG